MNSRLDTTPLPSWRRALGVARDRIPLTAPSGRDRVRIDHLVSPLRYDIVIRERYFRFLSQHHMLYDRNIAELIERSRAEPYFTWFREIVIPRFYPTLAGHDEGVAAAFRERVRAAVGLYRSFQFQGYDPRQPVTLRTGRVLAPTASGKCLARRIYAGDGCHRLALLRLTGTEILEPGTYRLRTSRVLAPRDNTSHLLRCLDVPPDDYFTFLARSYADTELHSKAALQEHVRRRDPARLDEMNRVLALDEPLLASEASDLHE